MRTQARLRRTGSRTPSLRLRRLPFAVNASRIRLYNCTCSLRTQSTRPKTSAEGLAELLHRRLATIPLWTNTAARSTSGTRSCAQPARQRLNRQSWSGITASRRRRSGGACGRVRNGASWKNGGVKRLGGAMGGRGSYKVLCGACGERPGSRRTVRSCSMAWPVSAGAAVLSRRHRF